MKNGQTITVGIIFSIILFSCTSRKITADSYKGSANTKGYTADSLPVPYTTSSAQNFSKVLGWNNTTPIAPEDFIVTKFADGLEHPRWIYVADNGDVFVAESNTVLKGIKKIGSKFTKKISTQHYGESVNRITMFRDADKNGVPDNRYVFMTGLNQPFGMLILDNKFYVANTDALKEFPYAKNLTSITDTGKTILTFPTGKTNRHWTRNIISNKDESKIYIAVGSGTNVAENGLDEESERACVWEINKDGSGKRIYASGLRNPVGIAWAPNTNTLWAAVNERDELGDELVPDYLTSVKENGFYGWPFAYYGQHEEPRMKDQQRPDLVAKTIVPDVALGSHTASLGLAFCNNKMFPSKYHDGAFIAQHGSWNRSIISGYKVVFVPFKNGKPSGPPEDFLTGFIANLEKSEVHGRPVCTAFLADGSMLVTDDASNTIWRIAYKK